MFDLFIEAASCFRFCKCRKITYLLCSFNDLYVSYLIKGVRQTKCHYTVYIIQQYNKWYTFLLGNFNRHDLAVIIILDVCIILYESHLYEISHLYYISYFNNNFEIMCSFIGISHNNSFVIQTWQLVLKTRTHFDNPFLVKILPQTD